MKFCIWTTSLQADTLALAIALDRDPDVDLLIVAANLHAFTSEPIARFVNLQCPMIDRSDENQESIVRAFNADVFLADNHIPKFLAGERMVFFWHGLPLKIQPRRDIRSFHRHCKRLVGKVTKPNQRFLAQCYNDIDLQHRVNHWKIDASNCRKWGSPYSDLLMAPPYQREDLEDYFGLEVGRRKNILLSLTWNYGDKAFGVLGDDDQIFRDILETAENHDANIIFSMHDRFRYQPGLIEKVEHYANLYPRSHIKYKNQHADNLADLVVSDVMICNFSSFIVFHYFMNKPSIHIQPVDTNKMFIGLPTMKGGGVRMIFRRNNHRLWIYPFTDNGGSLPLDGESLVSDLSKSLEDSSYCLDNAKRFIDERIYLPNGKTCERIVSDLKQWVD